MLVNNNPRNYVSLAILIVLKFIAKCSLSISYFLRGEVMTMHEVLLVFKDNLLDCNQEFMSWSSEFSKEEISSRELP